MGGKKFWRARAANGGVKISGRAAARLGVQPRGEARVEGAATCACPAISMQRIDTAPARVELDSGHARRLRYDRRPAWPTLGVAYD
jgi:hypothetical protein